MMYLSAYIKKLGHDCDLIISSLSGNIIEDIKQYSPDMITISCTTGIHTWALDLATTIKQNLNATIILGGPHPTYFPNIIEHPAVDMICIGEGEIAFGELLSNFGSTNINSFIIKKEGKIYKNPLGDLWQDLDTFGFPDRELYRRYPFIMNQDNLRVITCRGCLYNCSFCYNPPIKRLYAGKGKYVRRRSIPHVIEEMEQCKKKYNCKRIDFQDDVFILDFETWVKPFLQVYKEKIGLPFTCNVYASLVNDEVASLMKDAGCHSVKMGIETADEELNKKVLNKWLSNSIIEKAIRAIKNNGIKLETFNLIGIPGEKIEQAIKTMEFNARLGVDFARCALVQPYPNTDLEKYVKEQGFVDESYDVDQYENSYFIGTPIKLENKEQFINLQRLFSVGVRFPRLIPVIKKLIKLKPNRIFDSIFKIDYAISIKMMDKVSLKDFFNFGIRSKGFFSKKK